jgi:hypothetical protein
MTSVQNPGQGPRRRQSAARLEWSSKWHPAEVLIVLAHLLNSSAAPAMSNTALHTRPLACFPIIPDAWIRAGAD